VHRGKTRILTPRHRPTRTLRWRGAALLGLLGAGAADYPVALSGSGNRRRGSRRAMTPLDAAVFAILTAVTLATEADATSTELWTAFCTTGPALYCQVYAQAIASALMVQGRVCLLTTVSSLTLADVALRYKRLQPDKVPEFAVDLLVDAFTAAWPCADGEQLEPARPIAHEWARDFSAGGDASGPATVYAWGVSELLIKDHKVCLPPGLRPMGLTTRVVYWLREHPDLLTAPAAVVMLQAMPALWPCHNESAS
jgi:hypothetical protein